MKCTAGVLASVPTRQLRAWLRKARGQGLSIRPPGYDRELSLGALTAELASRPDGRETDGGRYARRDRRRAQIRAARSNRAGRRDR